MREHTCVLFAAALVAAALTAACSQNNGSETETAASASPPNIVVILADDLGYADVSTYGNRVQTPNIDRIGREGAVFTQGYVTTPVCSPSRAGLLTGRYQQRFGFEYNARQAPEVPDVGLIAGELTIADHLRAAGYPTGMVGKWHLGFKDEHYPTNRGFNEFYGHLSGATLFVNTSTGPWTSSGRRYRGTLRTVGSLQGRIQCNSLADEC